MGVRRRQFPCPARKRSPRSTLGRNARAPTTSGRSKQIPCGRSYRARISRRKAPCPPPTSTMRVARLKSNERAQLAKASPVASIAIGSAPLLRASRQEAVEIRALRGHERALPGAQDLCQATEGFVQRGAADPAEQQVAVGRALSAGHQAPAEGRELVTLLRISTAVKSSRERRKAATADSRTAGSSGGLKFNTVPRWLRPNSKWEPGAIGGRGTRGPDRRRAMTGRKNRHRVGSRFRGRRRHSSGCYED
jgi:hypothetical protein